MCEGNLSRKKKVENAHLPLDVSMEWAVSEFIRDGEAYLDQIYLQPLGAFRRGAFGDVCSIRTQIQKQGDVRVIIGVHREGLYDQLPEYLFHDFDRSFGANVQKVDSQRLESVARERTLARKFFYPIDCHFLRLLVKIFHVKRVLEYEVNDADWICRTLNWLGIDPNFFSEKEREMLVEFIPKIRDLSGRMESISNWLSKFLQTRVKIVPHGFKATPFPAEMKTHLGRGNARLGRNFVLGAIIPYGFFRVTVLVCDLTKKKLKAHINRDVTRLKIAEILKFLLPLNVIYEVRFMARREERTFRLDPIEKPRLGYHTQLKMAGRSSSE